ncbi:hypothetical protein PC118_g19722 [Phytophthora cactorum]|uniref:Uncharacterized protein n=1 Tax=Phytophthora cactorum TaxID=29920 RepID=A0A8T1AWF9_9STRA|nr:hypothetical protein PC114_g21929 [Phytophthora cactorum]KAG2890443.1 hypothetical protein PC115_g19499 [Phytophthora cactorum]KAG2965479.1 hypothetical protein PC118_g19722 [Phytophthora cactorum]KAG3051809.1 hypothetical protein PC121_g17645 [Phytophthora cactorum]KAG3060289.1 hypothetical protein PC122_g20023 [Phytophthora cactorum]
MRLYQHPLLRIQVLKSTVIKRRLRRGSTCRGQDVNQDRSSNSALTRWKPYHTRHLRDHNPDHRGLQPHPKSMRQLRSGTCDGGDEVGWWVPAMKPRRTPLSLESTRLKKT